jgi:hypothetical protein
MKKVLAVAALGLVLLASAPLPAHASAAVDAALALGAFATFGLLTAPFWAAAHAAPYYAPYYYPPAYYVPYYVPSYAVAPAPPAPPAIQREVVYPQGRYLLYGDGVRTAYQWVWVPNPPSGPPPAQTPPGPVR